MRKIIDPGRANPKVILFLLAVALVPTISVGLISLIEINQASKDVQESVLGLSSTLNRSALTAASNEADQVQIAVSKSRQYDEFFSRIKSENEIVANFASKSQDNSSCELRTSIWVAPFGANDTLLRKMKHTLSLLCSPSKLLREIVDVEPACTIGYVGTEDGVLLFLSSSNDDGLLAKAPFDHRSSSWYADAKKSERTMWTDPYIDSQGSISITCATPVRRGGQLFGVAAMNVSLSSISRDLSSQIGRGYPFIIDDSGLVVMRSSDNPRGGLDHLFDNDNFYESNSSEIRELVRTMLHGETGASVIGLGKADGYVAYAPINNLGWSFGIAYPVEEMSLPARFIDAGIRDTAKSVTKGVTDAVKVAGESLIAIITFAGLIIIVLSSFIAQKIEVQAKEISLAADKIRSGDLDIPEISEGLFGIVGLSISNMSDSIRRYITDSNAISESRGSDQREVEFWREIKHNLRPIDIPEPDGYGVVASSLSSDDGGFEFCDVMDLGDGKIALSMAEVSDGGIAGAMLAIASRVLIRSLSKDIEPSRALSELNLKIGEYSQGMNMACFYAVLDTSDHTIEFVNAGFNPAFITDSGGSVDTLGGGGIALGSLDRLELRQERIPVQPGDVLVIFSDGVTEASKAFGVNPGTERLITIIKENRSLSASEILAAIEAEIRIYMKDHPLSDDSSLIILKRKYFIRYFS
jgi:sigma-B regulation protein RsbU (phosphoserine phosphatase)